MCLLINCIKTIIILQSVRFGCGLKQQGAISQGFNASSIVSIYQLMYVNPTKSELVHKCIGILIKNNTVLAPSECAPINAEPVLKIRRYDLNNYNYLISEQTLFDERTVLRISSFQTEDNNLNLITLSQPFILDSLIPLKSRVRSKKKKNPLEFIKNYYRTDYCILETTIPSRRGIKVIHKPIVSIYKPDCCYKYGYASTINLSLFGLVTKEIISEECGNRLKDKTCFMIHSNDCKSLAFGGPVFCTDFKNLIYLYGMVSGKYQCTLEVAEINNEN